VASETWDVLFFQRHEDDDPNRTVPGIDFLDGCPGKVAATFQAIVEAVAEAPPPRFAEDVPLIVEFGGDLLDEHSLRH